jgi:serine/threonine protein kinase
MYLCVCFNHSDLKSGNILIGAHSRMKIADFGLSHVKTRSMHELGSYGVVGTPCYMAPEVIKKEKYGVKADVFSLGVVLCEMLTGMDAYPIRSVQCWPLC